YAKALAAKNPKLAAALQGKAAPPKTVKGDAAVLARDLLRIDEPLIAAAVGLVDDFQATDPVQGEVIKKLAQDADGRFVPGKLFLVGDPKQSIYSFRGADIIAYKGLVQE